jgi:glycerophosphoryl diester phosphodiesterase
VPASWPEPLIFAHRGSSEALPEHTLASYLRAIEDGVDGVECDVRLTRDGHLVCVHDRRLDRTSDGRGLVRRRTLAELERLDFGSWHSAPARVLTLDELLAAVRDAGRPVRVLVETKHPNLGGRQLEPRLAATLRRFGLDRSEPDDPGGVSVMSFSPLSLRRMQVLAPAVPRVMLLEMLPPGLASGRLPAGVRIGGPGIALVRARPQLVRRLHAHGHRVYVWTVNDPADVDLVLRLRVEGIITDRPRLVRHRIADTGGDAAGPSAADSQHGRRR